MKSFAAAYKNELFKIRKRKKITVSAILTAVLVAGAAAAVFCMNHFAGIRIRGGTEFATMMLSIANKTLIPLFTAFICIDMFGGEFSSKTIRLSLTRPVTRIKLFSAKTAAAGTFLAMQLLFLMVLALAAELVLRSGSISFGRVLTAYAAAFVPLMVFVVMVVFISNVMKGTTSAFLVTALVFLLLIAAPLLFGGYRSLFFTSLLDWHTLFVGSYLNFGKILRSLGILLGCGMVLFAGGYYLFDRKEF